MPYVPGLAVDVFISYCHADNQDAWVTNFEQALKGRLHVLLGKEPEVWRDTRKLSGEHDFTQEIKLRLERTAVLVVVVSPGYLGSPFCWLERQHFTTHARGGVRVGTRLKLVKIIKYPHEQGLHETFAEGLGFPFFNEKGEYGPIEYFPGDRDFVLRIDHLAKGITNILRDMYNATQPVYVAEPPPTGIDAVWNHLRSELGSLGFGVLPSFRLEEKFPREILVDAMKPAAATVHLLGLSYSEFAARQIRIAAELKSANFIWLPPDVKPEQGQEEFLRALTGFDILRTTPDWQLAATISDRLKPKPALSAKPAGGPKRIYLICDRKNPADNDAASQLGADIAKRERMEVALPEVDRDAAILDEHQQKRLAECDGVLLYWGQARKEWFYENYGDLVKAERRLRAQSPFTSRAIILDQPDMPDKNQAPAELVLRLRPPAIDSLEPFLKPLRGAAAGA